MSHAHPGPGGPQADHRSGSDRRASGRPHRPGKLPERRGFQLQRRLRTDVPYAQARRQRDIENDPPPLPPVPDPVLQPPSGLLKKILDAKIADRLRAPNPPSKINIPRIPYTDRTIFGTGSRPKTILDMRSGVPESARQAHLLRKEEEAHARRRWKPGRGGFKTRPPKEAP